MQQIKVQKGEKGEIILTYPDSDHPPLEMNFAPICKRFGLKSGLLLHWQSKPFGIRCWGVYEIATGDYASMSYDKIHFDFARMQTLQMKEQNNPGVKPTAVLYFPDTKLTKDKGYYEVKRNA